MRLKKSKEPKKYAVGGFVAAGALGALQSALGAGQMLAGQAAASRIKEASTARPSEYAELLKQARNADLETRRIEELNRQLPLALLPLREPVAVLLSVRYPEWFVPLMLGAIDILGQRQAQTMQALQFGAQGAEREIGREINREMMERGAAQAAIEGGLQNFAGGLGQIGSAAIYSGLGKTAKDVAKEVSPNSEAAMRKETMRSLNKTQRERDKIGESLVNLQGQLDEDQVPLLAANRSKVANILAPEEDEFNLGSRLFQLPSQLKDGGMITDGKFSHKANPIDIVQKGRKVGEMTGGEVILNPEQQKKLSKESKYFRTLLKKFNKQK
jgi:hypothetical protein